MFVCMPSILQLFFVHFAVKKEYLTAKNAKETQGTQSAISCRLQYRLRHAEHFKEAYQNNIHIFTKSRKWNYATLAALWICSYDTVPNVSLRPLRLKKN